MRSFLVLNAQQNEPEHNLTIALGLAGLHPAEGKQFERVRIFERLCDIGAAYYPVCAQELSPDRAQCSFLAMHRWDVLFATVLNMSDSATADRACNTRMHIPDEYKAKALRVATSAARLAGKAPLSPAACGRGHRSGLRVSFFQ